jgi:hypothetical protein
MKQNILLMGFVVLITTASCLKDLDEDLPTATQSGNNIFGCKIEGKSWVPNGTHDIFVSIPAITSNIIQSQGVKYLHISARKDPSAFNNEEDAYDDMDIDVMLPSTPGEMIIDKTCNSCDLYCPYSSLRFKIKGLLNGGCFITDSSNKGKIHFTKIDTLNRIVSGTFEFKAIDKNTGKIISVTDGRFDVVAR